MQNTEKFILKQGELVPDAAIGFSPIIYFPILLLSYLFTTEYVMELSLTIFAMLFFAIVLTNKQIVFDLNSPHSYQIRYMIWGIIPLTKNMDLSNYSHFIIKTTKKTFGIGSVISVHLGRSRASINEEYVAIFGKHKLTKETSAVCKCSR